MQTRRLPISTIVFLVAIALLISSAFVDLFGGNLLLLISSLLAITFIALPLQAFRGIGRTYRWLISGWRYHGILLADAVIIYAIIKYIEALLLNELPKYALSTILINWGPIFLIWFLFEVAGILSKASNQLVIDEVDLSADSKQEGKKGAGSDKGGKIETNGLADLLAVNINRTSELYRAVDEKRAIKSESGAVAPLKQPLSL